MCVYMCMSIISIICNHMICMNIILISFDSHLYYYDYHTMLGSRLDSALAAAALRTEADRRTAALYVYAYISLSLYIYIYMCVSLSPSLHVHTYAHVYYIYIYIYIYMSSRWEDELYHVMRCYPTVVRSGDHCLVCVHSNTIT